MTTRWLAMVLLASTAACGPARPVPAPSADTEAAQAPAPAPTSVATSAVDPATEVINYVGDQLAYAGYRCAANDIGYTCATHDVGHDVHVVYYGDSNELFFYTTAWKATERPCAEAARSVTRDLRTSIHPREKFRVHCDDQHAEVRMETRMTYDEDIQLTAWMDSHLRTRSRAWPTLERAGLIR